MALPIIQSYTTNTGLSLSSLNLTKPSNVNIGDLLLIIAGSDDTTNVQQFNSFTDGDGCQWNLVKEVGDAVVDAHIAAFWRIADGTEGASVSVPAQSLDDIYGWYLHITGARNVGDPIHKIGGKFVGNTTSTEITGLETTFKDCLIICVYAYDGGDGGTFNVSGAGWTKLDQQNAGTGSGNGSGCVAYLNQESPGDVQDITITNSLADGSTGFMFAIARDGAPSQSLKMAVLKALDEVWEIRLSDEPVVFVAGHLFEEREVRVIAMSRAITDSITIKIKDKGEL